MNAAERQGRALVTERDNSTCIICHRGGEPNWHHRKLRSQGGTWDASNGILLCGSGTLLDHGKVHSKPGWARENGYIVPSWSISSEYPCRRWLPTSQGALREAWVLLADDGTWEEISAFEADRRIDGDWPGMRVNGREV